MGGAFPKYPRLPIASNFAKLAVLGRFFDPPQDFVAAAGAQT
jgi:hypothetical protein